MSTRASLAYAHVDHQPPSGRYMGSELHVYKELLDDTVHMEVVVDGAEINLVLPEPLWERFVADVRGRMGP